MSWTSCGGPPATSADCSIRDGAATSPSLPGRSFRRGGATLGPARDGRRRPAFVVVRASRRRLHGPCSARIASTTPASAPRLSSTRPVLAGRSDVASTRAAAAPAVVARPLPDTCSHEAVPASHARASANAGLDPRVATHLLVARCATGHVDVVSDQSGAPAFPWLRESRRPRGQDRRRSPNCAIRTTGGRRRATGNSPAALPQRTSTGALVRTPLRPEAGARVRADSGAVRFSTKRKPERAPS